MSNIKVWRAHPDYRALVKKVGTSFDIHNIEIYQTHDCLACVSGIKRGRYVIAYNPVEMRQFTYWGKVAIIAHEIGHIYNKDLSRRPRNWRESHWRELEADWFAGWVLYFMGANLFEAMSMYDNYEFERSQTHPGEEQRRRSLRSGWMASKNYYSNQNVG